MSPALPPRSWKARRNTAKGATGTGVMTPHFAASTPIMVFPSPRPLQEEIRIITERGTRVPRFLLCRAFTIVSGAPSCRNHGFALRLGLQRARWLTSLPPGQIPRKVFTVDAQTRERGPSAEQPQRAKEAPKTSPDHAHDAPDQKPAKRSLRERIRQHWLLATIGALALVAALVGGLLYWMEVRHYES